MRQQNETNNSINFVGYHFLLFSSDCTCYHFVWSSMLIKTLYAPKGQDMSRELNANLFGRYFISKNGDVYSLFCNGKKRIIPLKMKLSIGVHGYKHTAFRTNGKSKTIFIHRLVAKIYLKKIKGKNIVAHIDGVKTNNNLKNLRWSTQQENERDKHTHGTSLIGIKNVKSKLNDEKAREILRLKGKEKIKHICIRFKVSQSAIRNIWNRITWKHIRL